MLHALLHISTKNLFHTVLVSQLLMFKEVHVLVHCKFTALPDKILVRWKDVRKTNILQSDAAIVPDIGIPMVILPGRWRYDCAYGPEHNM